MVSDASADMLPGCLLKQRNGHLEHRLGLIVPLILRVDRAMDSMGTGGDEERELAEALTRASTDDLYERDILAWSEIQSGCRHRTGKIARMAARTGNIEQVSCPLMLMSLGSA